MTQLQEISSYLAQRGPRTRNEIANDVGMFVSHVCYVIKAGMRLGIFEIPYSRLDETTGEMNEVVALVPHAGPRQGFLERWT